MGISLALPYLEAMTPITNKLSGSSKIPKRLIFVSFPYGVTEEYWFPKGDISGKLILSEGLEPLGRHLDDISVISNLSNLSPPNSVHSSCTTFLTCANLRRNPKIGFLNSESVDQVAARHLGLDTRFSSLEFSAKNEGGMGPGLSLAWDNQGNAIPGYNDPLAIFNRLFGEKNSLPEDQRIRLTRRQSILDIIMNDASALKIVASKTDMERVDEYFTSIRQIEKKLEKEYKWIDRKKPMPTMSQPEGKLEGSQEIKIFFDLMAAAIQTDSSRVITYRQPLQSLIREVDKRYGTHQISHYKNFDERLNISRKKDQLQSELFAYFLDSLKAVREPDGSRLIDNCLVAYGTGVRAVHTQKDFPIVVAGGKAMGIQQGQHLVYESGETPLANLWLTFLKASGVPATNFAESTGTLDDMLI
jgi:hypothetical protein